MLEDARLLELTWLSQLEKKQEPSLPSGDCPERRLAVHLLTRGLAVDTSGPKLYQCAAEEVHRIAQWQGAQNVDRGFSAQLAITHAGAVRRAELEQQLKSGRIKDSMGLVWDGRHFRQDARIALLEASEKSPLAVAYLDLNDVRAFNAISHATGDAAIRRYLEVIAELTFDRGDAYRLSGGADEVVILLPRLQLDQAVEHVRKLLVALSREVVAAAELTLRAAAGVVVTTDSAESVDGLKARADAEQGRAKERSRVGEGRPSVLAWADELEVQAPPRAAA